MSPRPEPARSVLWISHYAAVSTMSGGTRHLELGRELERLGWRVTVAASDFHLQARTYARRKVETDRSTVSELVDGVEFRWLWASPYQTNNSKRVWNWITFGRSVLELRDLGTPSIV